MRRWTVASASALAVIVSLFTTGSLQAQGAAAPAAPPQTGARAGAPSGPPQPATVPAPRDDNRHKTFLDIARGSTIELLFVGDSITDGWRGAGQTIWDQHFAPFKAANFGIGGDTTQGVLWRMQNGELDGYKAKLIVLMLGTNNIARKNSNDEIVEGNRLIVEEFRQRQPQAKVLVLGIFPRAVQATDPYRASIKDINSKLAKLADNKNVFFMDIGDKFLTSDGTLTPEIMPDALHPNFRGYQIWADAISGRVKQLMR